MPRDAGTLEGRQEANDRLANFQPGTSILLRTIALAAVPHSAELRSSMFPLKTPDHVWCASASLSVDAESAAADGEQRKHRDILLSTERADHLEAVYYSCMDVSQKLTEVGAPVVKSVSPQKMLEYMRSSAFPFYLECRYAILKGLVAGLGYRAIVQLAAREWRDMPKADRKPYQTQATEQAERVAGLVKSRSRAHLPQTTLAVKRTVEQADLDQRGGQAGQAKKKKEAV